MSSPSPTTRRERPLATWQFWLRIVERSLAIVGGGILLFLLTLSSSVIVSESMEPTLQGTSWQSGDRVISEKVSYWFRRPRRWEIVAFRRDDGMLVMKRVIGLPGESIHMQRDGTLFVNDVETPRPDALSGLRYIPLALLFEERKVECAEGYFVVGDNSRDSDDSRYDGPIPAASIVGRCWLIVSPWSRMGWVR